MKSLGYKFPACLPENVRGSLGLTVPEFARVLCLNPGTVYRWKKVADSIVGSGPGPNLQIDGFAGRVFALIAAKQPDLGGEVGHRVRSTMQWAGDLGGAMQLLTEVITPALPFDQHKSPG